MAAGVHFSRVGRRVFRPGFFRDGQGVRIGPKGNGIFRAEVEPGAERAVHGREGLAVQPGQGILEVCKGLGQIPVQLRDAVERPAVSVYLHGSRLLCKKFRFIIRQLPSGVNFPLVNRTKRW